MDKNERSVGQQVALAIGAISLTGASLVTCHLVFELRDPEVGIDAIGEGLLCFGMNTAAVGIGGVLIGLGARGRPSSPPHLLTVIALVVIAATYDALRFDPPMESLFVPALAWAIVGLGAMRVSARSGIKGVVALLRGRRRFFRRKGHDST